MSAATFLERKRNRIDLFIASTDAEAKGLVDDLGYSEKQIKVIGLTRYTDDGTTYGYLYSPLENSYFCTDTTQKYNLDFVENRG